MRQAVGNRDAQLAGVSVVRIRERRARGRGLARSDGGEEGGEGIDDLWDAGRERMLRVGRDQQVRLALQLVEPAGRPVHL